MRTGVLVVLSFGCFAGSLAAQDRAIPRDLVLALFAHEMAFDSARPMQILVGKVPDNLALPKLNLPVMGALQHAHGLSLVYRVSGDANQARRAVQAQLRAAGWENPEGNEQPPDVGFVGAEEAVGEMVWCRGEDLAVLHTAMIRSDLQILKIDLLSMGGCSGGQVGWTSYGVLSDDTPLPRLEPPKTARVFGSMTPGSVSTGVSNAFVLSDLTTVQIMDHYGGQMQAKGWNSRGGTSSEFTSVHTWRIAQDGKEWMATMIATQLPERRHVVEISVYNLTQLTR
jgi:hypothetical protein